MSYFRAGFWHFVLAIIWAIALTSVTGARESVSFPAFPGDDALFWLRSPAFLAPLVASSSALFFVPDAWAKWGVMKFLHYPLPDWDVLLLGPASHRNFFTHSPILPLLAMLFYARFADASGHAAWVPAFGAGLSAGIGSHLFWDCVGSRRHTIIVVPYAWKLRERPSRAYLLMGAAICCGAALFFARIAAQN